MPAYPVDAGPTSETSHEQWRKLYAKFKGGPFADGISGLIRSCAIRGAGRVMATPAFTGGSPGIETWFTVNGTTFHFNDGPPRILDSQGRTLYQFPLDAAAEHIEENFFAQVAPLT